jgi:FixJ family two-component response regulator
MNGRELSQRITKAAPRARVLFMSGYTEDAIVHRGVLDVDVNFLSKPFTPDKLTDAVQEALFEGVRDVRSA